MSEAYHSKDVICMDSTQTKIVPCDSPQAAYRLVGAGGEVSGEDVKKYDLLKLGLLEGAPEAEPKPKAEPEKKAVETAPQNKAVAMPKGKAK